MRTLGGLQQHLQGELLTLAFCTKITRLDGVVLGITTLDRDINVDGVVYRAATGARVSAIKESNGLSVDNMELSGIINNDVFTQDDIISGLFVGAKIHHFQINYTSPGSGKLWHLIGFLGNVKIEGRNFAMELRGLTQPLTRNNAYVLSPDCPYRLGHGHCSVDLAPLTYQGAVAAITDQTNFNSAIVQGSDDGFFNNGEIEWLSGKNHNRIARVRQSFSDGTVILAIPQHGKIRIDDQFKITRGCDKTINTCHSVYNNIIEYGGAPYVPGSDVLMEHPS